MTSAYANLLLRPDLGKKAYRLKCRFRIGAFPKQQFLDKAKIQAADWFVGDMHKRGFEYVDRYGFRMKGPFSAIDPMTLRRPKRISSRQMLPMILQGAKFRDEGGSMAINVPILSESENWEYELSGVFVHKTMLVEQPDKGEIV